MLKISPKIILKKLEEVNYFINLETATILYLAIKLKKPILVEGPAGVGKTELANSMRKAFDYDFVKLQCYEGIDESKSLYEWEYGKQLLYTQILKDRLNEITKSKKLDKMVEDLSNFDTLFFSENFLLERPLLKAIRNKNRTLLLIDEIDKSEAEFEAFLLEILSEFQVTIPELGVIKNKQIPLVILTSNAQRNISDALRRRALFLYLDYPDKELEKKIIKRKVPDLDDISINKIVELISLIRSYPLKKAPGTSETIEWANSLLFLGGLTPQNIKITINVITKYKEDRDYIKARINDFL